MTPRGEIIIATIAAVLLLIMLDMLRRRRINEEVCLLWVFALVSVILLAAVPGLAELVTHLAGAVYPASALTMCALGFIGAMLVYTSVKISRLSSEVKALAQRQAVFEVERQKIANNASK